MGKKIYIDKDREYILRLQKLLFRADLWAAYKESQDERYEQGVIEFTYKPGVVYKKDVPQVLMELMEQGLPRRSWRIFWRRP